MIFQPPPHWDYKHVPLLQTLSNVTYIFILVMGEPDYNYPCSHQWVSSFPPLPTPTPPFFFFSVLGIELGALSPVGMDSGAPKYVFPSYMEVVETCGRYSFRARCSSGDFCVAKQGCHSLIPELELWAPFSPLLPSLFAPSICSRLTHCQAILSLLSCQHPGGMFRTSFILGTLHK